MFDCTNASMELAVVMKALIEHQICRSCLKGGICTSKKSAPSEKSCCSRMRYLCMSFCKDMDAVKKDMGFDDRIGGDPTLQSRIALHELKEWETNQYATELDTLEKIDDKTSDQQFAQALQPVGAAATAVLRPVTSVPSQATGTGDFKKPAPIKKKKREREEQRPSKKSSSSKREQPVLAARDDSSSSSSDDSGSDSDSSSDTLTSDDSDDDVSLGKKKRMFISRKEKRHKRREKERSSKKRKH